MKKSLKLNTVSGTTSETIGITPIELNLDDQIEATFNSGTQLCSDM